MLPYAQLLDTTIEKWKPIAHTRQESNLFIVWTVAPVIDASYYARSAQNYAQELGILLEKRQPDKPFFFDRSVQEGPFVPLRSSILTEKFIDPDSKAFRMYEGDQPSTQAIDLALRTLFADSLQRPNKVVVPDLYSLVGASGEFLRRSYNESEQAYSLSPWREPDVFGTFCAVSAISTYQRVRTSIPGLPNIEFTLESIADGLVRDDFTVEDSSVFGFRDANAKSPCLSLTALAYRTALELGSLLGDTNGHYQELLARLMKRVPKVLNLIKLCWNRESGGFKKIYENGYSPDLLHTRYALQLLRTFLSAGVIDSRDVNWLESGALLRFADSCRFEKALANFPGTIASMCSQRFGLSMIKLTVLFVLENALESSAEYDDALRRLQTEVLANVSAFVDSCRYPDSSLYLGFPHYAVPLKRETSDRFKKVRPHSVTRGVGLQPRNPRWREIYQELRQQYGVPELSPDAIRSVSEDAGGEDFLIAWRFYLREKDRLLKKYRGQYVAIIGETVIASAPVEGKILQTVLQKYPRRPVFVEYVAETEPSGVPRLS